MKGISTLTLAAIGLLLVGCTSTPEAEIPQPTVTVTASSAPAPAEDPEVGDELTLLNAWDICFAHTTTQVDSDLTEWSRFSPDLVMQEDPGTFIVTIEGVRNESNAAGTVTCQAEGRVGGAVIADWSLN